MEKTLSGIGEFGLIARLQDLVEKAGGPPPPGVRRGIGDDAAVLQPRKGCDILITCDCIVEGRHYLKEHIRAFDLGRRAMSLNISDIGAMGGDPRYALVSLGLDGDTEVSYIEDLYRGFFAELEPMGAVIIGGNITRSAGGMFIDITLLGEMEEGRAMTRSGACLNDAVLVTGHPGESAAGLALLLAGKSRPGLGDHPLVRTYTTPGHRAREGRALALSGRVTSMIDTSDGFLGDLGHICRESRLGAEIHEERLPVSDALVEAASELDRDPVAFFLGESDDYELIMTCPPADVEAVVALIAGLGDVRVTEVGRMIRPEGGIRMKDREGRTTALQDRGWDHFLSAG